jgi:hypothetical protein
VQTLEIPTPDPRTLDDTARPFAEAVAARFAIKRMIGRGGMGMVFLARDRRLDRLVAIKTLPPAVAADAEMRERFLRETRTAGSMSHPNIVPIHGADEVDGHVFFVMSYVDGESLAARVRRNGRIESRAVARYLRDVAAALAHAHARGIVHRDIKAENILLERESDHALVTDFGIARLAEATPLTITGQVLGTVHYVSPEQVAGLPVDARSDIYSLGVVGFLALTGRFPFDADVASAVLVQHVTHTAPAVRAIAPEVPAALAAIVDRCLSRDAGQRYASAEALVTAIDAAALDADGGARPTVVTDAEANAVWKRAAELQARTGVHPRPAPVARPRAINAHTPGQTPRPGLSVGEVLAAASEAGIDRRYVEHALVEQGLAGGAGTPPGSPSTDPRARRTMARRPIVAMLRAEITHTTAVNGELPARDIKRLINVLRDQTDQIGTTVASTRELAWRADTLGSQLEVSVVPNDGGTTITLVRRMRLRNRLARTLLAAGIGLATAMLIGGVLAEAWRNEDEIAVLVGSTLGILVAVRSGLILMKRYRTRAASRLAALADMVATKVRESVR